MPNAHGLGRIPSPPDDRDYKLATYLHPSFGITQMYWGVGPVLDQGDSGHCVGFGFADWGNTLPVDDDYSGADGDAIYYECKVIDGEPRQEDGTSVRSGAKAMKQRGRLAAYAFGSLPDAKTFLLNHGPVVFGIDWYDGMFTPNASGVVRPTGSVAGGHGIAAYGADATYCYLQNSWGTSWGQGGKCKITWADLAVCMANGGEACAAVELPVFVPTPPPAPAPPTPTGLKAALQAILATFKAAVAALEKLISSL
ncbi:MAG TPA: C1 family peptidase [Candidatus Limnocylindrales bacterium]